MVDFRLEKHMTSPAAHWLASRRLRVKTELRLPWGVCDLVGCALDEEHVEKRQSLRQKRSIGSLLRIHILMQLPDVEEGRGIGHKRLMRMYDGLISVERLNNEVDWLIRNSFAATTETGSFQRINGWMPLHRQIVAVELKLARVEEALCQATANLEFADESYIGLPAYLAERVARSRKAKDILAAGVGLLGVGERDCHVVLPPKRDHGQQTRSMQMLCAERFWRTHITDI